MWHNTMHSLLATNHPPLYWRLMKVVTMCFCWLKHGTRPVKTWFFDTGHHQVTCVWTYHNFQLLRWKPTKVVLQLLLPTEFRARLSNHRFNRRPDDQRVALLHYGQWVFSTVVILLLDRPGSAAITICLLHWIDKVPGGNSTLQVSNHHRRWFQYSLWEG